MRRSIQTQLLVPMLVVVGLGIALTSVASAFINVARARADEEQRLRTLADSLAAAEYPFTPRVLEQLAVLSQAEFVLFDRRGGIEAAQPPLDVASQDEVRRWVRSTFRKQVDERPQRLQRNGREMLGHPVFRRRARTENEGGLIILMPASTWRSLLWTAAAPTLLAGLISASLAVAMTVWLSRRFVSPIHRLVDQARAIGAGELRPVPLPSVRNELSELTETMNGMVERLREQEQRIRHGERLKTLGQLGASLSHQLRNAVTGARLGLEFHSRELPSAYDRESLEVVQRQLLFMETYLQKFLKLGRPESRGVEAVSVAGVISSVAALVGPSARHANVGLYLSVPTAPLPSVRGESVALQQMLLNLVLNAIEAATRVQGEAGKVEIVFTGDGRSQRLEVWDNGPGPRDALKERLFEPFVTDKADGTGLGLAMAKEIAESHGAALAWRREDGRTCFSVEWSDGATREESSRATSSG